MNPAEMAQKMGYRQPLEGNVPQVVQEMINAGYKPQKGPQEALPPQKPTEMPFDQKHPIISSVVRSLVSPWLNAGVTGYAATEGSKKFADSVMRDPSGVASSLVKGTDLTGESAKSMAEAKQAFEPKDFGFFGKVSPIGSGMVDENGANWGKMGDEARRMAGTGAQLAPYFMGSMGFAPKAAGLASAMNAAGKTGSVMGMMTSGGSALADTSKGAGDVALETALGAPTGYLAGAGTELGKNLLLKLFGWTSGLGNKLKTITSKPDEIKGVQAQMKEGTNPFWALAQEEGQRINSQYDAAQKSYTNALSNFDSKFPEQRFDLAQRSSEEGNLLTAIRKLQEDFAADVTITPIQGGQNGFKVDLTRTSSFTPQQAKYLEQAVNQLTGYDNLSATEVANVPKAMGTFFEKVPKTNEGNYTPYHAAIGELQDKTSSQVQKILPKSLQAANRQYSEYYKAMKDIGSKLVDKQTGGVAPGAESYLSNLSNANKTELANRAGSEIMGKVDTIKAAQAMQSFLPPTGGRVGDVLRALAAAKMGLTGLGSLSLANPTAAIPSLAAMGIFSPAIVGNVGLGIGTAAKAGLTQPVKQAVQNAAVYPSASSFSKQLKSLF